eukprot:8650018-Pyramimonas_sp.AAC.1
MRTPVHFSTPVMRVRMRPPAHFGTPLTRMRAPWGAPLKEPVAGPACVPQPMSAHPSQGSWPQKKIH